MADSDKIATFCIKTPNQILRVPVFDKYSFNNSNSNGVGINTPNGDGVMYTAPPPEAAYPQVRLEEPTRTVALDNGTNYDIVFVVDSSGSISDTANNEMYYDLVDVINELSDENTKYGLTEFRLDLENIVSIQTDSSQVKNQYPTSTDGGTEVDDGLHPAVDMLLNNGRNNAEHIIILQSDTDGTGSESDRLKNNDGFVITVAYDGGDNVHTESSGSEWEFSSGDGTKIAEQIKTL
jgi:hypothetical protein